MRVLLDECVPAPLAKFLFGHECSTVQQAGWAGIGNGELLRLAASTFDVFLSADQGIPYQQNLGASKMSVLLLSTNDLRRLQNAVPLILGALGELGVGESRSLDIP